MAKKEESSIVITAPNFRQVKLRLKGTAPYMQARFSAKAMQQMKAKHEAGSTARKGVKKEPRDFDADYQNAMHVSADGWVGVPASAIRNACIDVCRMTGFKMTHAKMSLFVNADGNDVVDGCPLVKLQGGEPERVDMATRNATGVADIRVRPMWRDWYLDVTVTFDGDQFTTEDVVNLLHRAGMQVGIGEGRPFSKSSNGLGYGTFSVQAA